MPQAASFSFGSSLPCFSSSLRAFHNTARNKNNAESTPPPFAHRGRRSSQDLLPTEAQVVIVGGGVIGTSVAYHLAQRGITNVVLLEQGELTSGTTWHAAGLMNSFGSTSHTSTWMRQYTQDLYRHVLPHQTGLETGYQDSGFLELACDEHRLEHYRRIAAVNRYWGVDVQELTPTQVQDQVPLLDTSSILAGFFVASDGRANPTDVTRALAKGATQRGHVTIVEHCPVVGITTAPPVPGQVVPHVSGVQVDLSSGGNNNNRNDNKDDKEAIHVIQTRKVVNCTGMWARQFGEACGVMRLPNQAAEHYYLITEALNDDDDLDLSSWPVVEDSSRCTYIRPEGKGLLLGLFETHGAVPPTWKQQTQGAVPHDFPEYGQLEPDWDRMTPYLERALELLPSLQHSVGIKTLFCGPESFTPDGCPMVGESPELAGYFVGAGLNSLGILTGGGLGKILADWVATGHAPDTVDVTGIHVNRFHAPQSNPQYRQDRIEEVLGHTYHVHFPDLQFTTGRNVKQTVLHENLKQAGACFRNVSGWESPAWYHAPTKDDRPPSSPPPPMATTFGREAWFDHWAAEHFACRNGVALFDMTFMSKWLVQGRDAGSFLNWLSTANVQALEDHSMIYTQWLNDRGTVEADVTITKWSDQAYWVMVTDTMHHHVAQHMAQRFNPSTDFVTWTDVTARYVQLNVQGPDSRALLQDLTTVDLSSQALPFRHVVELDLGLARVYCARITYVGELGYELYIPVEQAQHVYQQLVQAGQAHHLKHAGLKALGSLRLEKGYRDYGHDMDNTDTVLECGLGFTCDFDKPERPFVGQDAVQAQKRLQKQQGGLSRRLVSVLVQDAQPLMHGLGEVIWKNHTTRVGHVRAASYGHSLGGAVGLSMISENESPDSTTSDNTNNDNPVVINKAYLNHPDDTWQVEIGNQFYPCKLSLTPFYDPKSLRVKD